MKWQINYYNEKLEEEILNVPDGLLARYHQERNHQGKKNCLLFPKDIHDPDKQTGMIVCRSGLEGKLKYYHREAA